MFREKTYLFSTLIFICVKHNILLAFLDAFLPCKLIWFMLSVWKSYLCGRREEIQVSVCWSWVLFLALSVLQPKEIRLPVDMAWCWVWMQGHHVAWGHHGESNPSPPGLIVHKALLQVWSSLNSSLGKSLFMHLLPFSFERWVLAMQERRETNKCFADRCTHKQQGMQLIISNLLWFFSIHLKSVRCLLINGSCLFLLPGKGGNSPICHFLVSLPQIVF